MMDDRWGMMDDGWWILHEGWWLAIDDDGLPLAKSKRRGIITEDYQIEPFFEYYGGIDETQSPRLGK